MLTRTIAAYNRMLEKPPKRALIHPIESATRRLEGNLFFACVHHELTTGNHIFRSVDVILELYVALGGAAKQTRTHAGAVEARTSTPTRPVLCTLPLVVGLLL